MSINLLTCIRHSIFKVPPKIISNIAVVYIYMLLKSRNHNSDNNNKRSYAIRVTISLFSLSAYPTQYSNKYIQRIKRYTCLSVLLLI